MFLAVTVLISCFIVFGYIWRVSHTFPERNPRESVPIGYSIGKASSAEPEASNDEATQLADRLSTVAPAIPIASDSLSVLQGPGEFLNFLIENISRAKHRVILASLAPLSGTDGEKISNALCSASASSPSLRVWLMSDYWRFMADRDSPLVDTIGRQLFQHIPATCLNMSLYQNPTPASFLLQFIPNGIQAVSVLHTKILVMDDTVLLTGSNLAGHYFTSVLDRYVVVRNAPLLAQWYTLLAEALHRLSHPVLVSENGTLEPGPNATGANPCWNYCRFLQHSRHEMDSFLNKARALPYPSIDLASKSSKGESWTLCFPTLQHARVGIVGDAAAADHFFSSQPDQILLLSPYLNLYPLLRKQLLMIIENAVTRNTSEAMQNLILLTASAQNNRWSRHKVAKYFLPQMYAIKHAQTHALFSKRYPGSFQLLMADSGDHILHQKGVWLRQESSSFRSSAGGGGFVTFATIAGSSNYNLRSRVSDVESNVYLVTTNTRIQHELDAEASGVLERGRPLIKLVEGKPNGFARVALGLSSAFM